MSTIDKAPDALNEVEIEGSVETHLHGRNPVGDKDGRMEMIAESAVDEHEIIVVIGNTSPVLLTQTDVNDYIPKFEEAMPKREFRPTIMAAPLLTDATTPDMVREMRCHQPRNIANLKGFMAGVSNDGGHSVTDVRKLAATLHACHDNSVDAPPLAVDWHLERAKYPDGEDIPMLDREWYSVEHDLAAILEVDPEGRHTPKHISDRRTIERLNELIAQGYDLYGEIAPQYFIRTFEDLFKSPKGGTAFQAHELVWPLYKGKTSQTKLRTTATTKVPDTEYRYHFGGDVSWHIDDPTQPKNVKITDDGEVCGGIAILPALSKSIVIDLFVESGHVDLLNDFFSRVARKKLGLGPARTRMTYRREPWIVPEVFKGIGPNGEIKARPFMRGKTVNWKRVKTTAIAA